MVGMGVSGHHYLKCTIHIVMKIIDHPGCPESAINEDLRFPVVNQD
jgi:hypothetical protein